MEPDLRRAQPEDITAVRYLLENSGLPYSGVDDQFSEAFVVAEVEGEVIGVAGVERHGDCGLLRSVAVAKSYRGRGLGARLVNASLDQARTYGIIDIYLLTLDARSYFESFGFVAINRDQVPFEIVKSNEFAMVCPVSATVMVLRSVATVDRKAGENP